MTEKLLEEVLHQQRKQAEDLQEIKETLKATAVQDERIKHVENKVNVLFEKLDILLAQDGVLAKVREYQASCPRDDVDTIRKQLWGMVVTFGLAVMGLAWRTFK